MARRIHTESTKRSATYAEYGVAHHVDDFYGPFQEMGVKPHQRRSGSKSKANRWGRGRNAQDSREKKAHPGHKAQPHLRPAFDERRPQAEREAAEALNDELMKAIR